MIRGLPVLLLVACASNPTTPEPAPPADADLTTAALVQRLLAEEEPERIEAAGRLVAGGSAAVVEIRAALPTADRTGRPRLLAVLDDLDAWPPDVGPEERVDVLLWRLRGGHGGPSDRIRTLVRLAEIRPEVRGALAERARAAGPDRPLALYALARTGEPRAESILIEALTSEDDRVRSAANEGLEQLRTERPANEESGRARGRQG